MNQRLAKLSILLGLLLLAACADEAPVGSTNPSEASGGQAAETDGVPYFTPSQQEGPYYPVEKLSDQDNDLTVVEGAEGEPAGEVLEFSGIVYDATGTPLEGVLVEIWQTDNNGAYLHPNDPETDNRDRNFQFFGESVTDVDGRYFFRTIMPGKYEPRPVHIHFKVWAGGDLMLTSQFYFAGDPSLEDEGLTTGNAVHLLVDVTDGLDSDGDEILIGERDVILRDELVIYHSTEAE